MVWTVTSVSPESIRASAADRFATEQTFAEAELRRALFDDELQFERPGGVATFDPALATEPIVSDLEQLPAHVQEMVERKSLVLDAFLAAEPKAEARKAALLVGQASNRWRSAS